MRFAGKNIEIKPLDSLNTITQTKDRSDLSPEDENFELYLNLKEKIPEFKVSFKKDICIYLENLSLKIGIEYNIEKINSIIDALLVRFLSSEDTSLFQNRENLDEYNIAYYSNGIINFNLLYFVSKGENLKKILYHEFLHALSTNNDKIIYEIEEDGNFKKQIGPQSTGLKFSGLKNKRFEWINEAVTEQIAMSLTQTDESSSYIKERQLLGLLNLDFDLLTKTYLRHIRKREEGGDTEVDDWREFSEEVDQVFGTKFLVKLDLFIEKNGIDKAIEVISSWSDGYPNIDDLKINHLNFDIPEGFYDIDDSEL